MFKYRLVEEVGWLSMVEAGVWLSTVVGDLQVAPLPLDQAPSHSEAERSPLHILLRQGQSSCIRMSFDRLHSGGR